MAWPDMINQHFNIPYTSKAKSELTPWRKAGADMGAMRFEEQGYESVQNEG